MKPADLIAQKKAEIAAKLAALKQGGVLGATPPVTPSSSSSKLGALDDVARRVAEAKKRVAAATSRAAVPGNPYMVRSSNIVLVRILNGVQQAAQAKRPAAPEVAAPQGAGLNMAAHPLLLDSSPVTPTSKKDRYKPMQPKFASIKASSNISSSIPPSLIAIRRRTSATCRPRPLRP